MSENEAPSPPTPPEVAAQVKQEQTERKLFHALLEVDANRSEQKSPLAEAVDRQGQRENAPDWRINSNE